MSEQVVRSFRLPRQTATKIKVAAAIHDVTQGQLLTALAWFSRAGKKMEGLDRAKFENLFEDYLEQAKKDVTDDE